MNATQRPKPPSHLVLTAVLTGSLTCILSLIYIVLCTVALIFRYNCNTIEVDTLKGSEHLVATLYRVYIQDSECSTSLTVENLTSDHNVFVLTCITLCASVVCLVAAAVLIGAVLSESAYQYVCIVVYGYIGVTIASIVVDLTFGVHFGIDYGYLTSELNNSSAGISVNYTIDVTRISAFLLMTLTLKGYICHLISLVLLVLLTIYAVQYSKILDQYEHSIHKLGVIKAFGAKDPRQSIQPRCENCQSNMSVSNRGSQHNLGFLNDEEPTLTRENSRRDRDDFSTPGFDRSYSWQQAPPPPGRPFSYLGDGNKRPAPAPPRVPSEPQWQRGPWAGPPVPVPDYSPTVPRRLKSALKSAYM